MEEDNKNFEFHFTVFEEKKHFEMIGRPVLFVQEFTGMLIEKYKHGNSEDKEDAENLAEMFEFISKCFNDLKDHN